jgi:hypothetical protein
MGKAASHTGKRNAESDLDTGAAKTSRTDDADSSALVSYIARAVEFSKNDVTLKEEEEEKKEAERLQRDGLDVLGYVYAVENPFYKNLIKICATTKTMEQRLKTLFNSSVPEPFTILIAVSTSDPFGLETIVHRHFCKTRKYGTKKEFFDTPREEIVEFLDSLDHDQRFPEDKKIPNQKKQNRAQALRDENTKLAETVEILRKNIETLKESNKRLTDKVNADEQSHATPKPTT